ncbi:MAG: hypothetical protein UT67_C0001G0002 [Candidatus Magasanikbacteria bacterium GW2011_GWA2_40_10]|uniref:Glycosyltransferase RgtA/B/C/D-like domain-containing protein n=1 Tax=Candidatus Magasanikbacteria bacterium GW2011_GWA2_40_10 TaxID=1619037 RepID=A0A0G0TC92_9BACT|nr:MAG: hypothetical protein UT67_C0001G0002 [Candidatus Magasanikbacteria bacterium GW2011_GWA2_40_10]
MLFYHASDRTFWMDETAVLEYLKNSPGGFVAEYWHNPDNHPPLYYFLVLLISKILPWTELTIRLVSIISGLGIVWLVYIFTLRVVQNKRTAILAAFFTAFSSYFVLISQMARYHSLAAFLSLLVFYFFYQLFVEGYSKRVWCWYLVMLVLVGYTDYPHFFYVAFITNALYFYCLARGRSIMPFFNWFIGQITAAIILSPLVWMIYHRIVIQGDSGWSSTNLLANSWVHIFTAIFFHIYSFFFGENIFPWNYAFFGMGVLVLIAVIAGFIHGFRKKMWTPGQLFVVLLSVALIILNTLFMNVADPRYNFIVYPKFGFVAYPLWIMSFVLCISKIHSKKVRVILILIWAAVELAGLSHFYQRNNYINGSYFNDFKGFEFVKSDSVEGDLLLISGDLNMGVYNFYKEKYFSKVAAVSIDGLQALLNNKQQVILWFFSTGSDGDSVYTSVTATDQIPNGFKIIKQFQSVPVDPILLKLKQKVTGRQSYIYKYGVYLLTNK